MVSSVINRKGYIRQKGVRVKSTSFVAVKRPGSLEKYDYKLSESDAKRRIALEKYAKDIRKNGVHTKEKMRALGKIALLQRFNKRNPPLYKNAGEDRAYLNTLLK